MEAGRHGEKYTYKGRQVYKYTSIVLFTCLRVYLFTEYPMTGILALIPARGGSKGIPRKNIRSFAGYPLIAWSISAAKQSQLVTRIIVSTDDEEIASVARECGAETPFLRPAELAQDQTTDLPVFEQPAVPCVGILAQTDVG
jgi:hypothetical protein